MNMHEYDELIQELSGLCGILPEYWDITGKKHIASIDTKKAILRAMNMQIDTVDDVARQINERRWKAWRSFVAPVHVLSVNAHPVSIPVYIPVKEGEEKDLTVSLLIEDEKGNKAKVHYGGDALRISEQQWIDDMRFIKVNLPFDATIKIGYHALTVTCRHPQTIFPGGSDVIQKTTSLIITPDACYLPSGLQNGRAWGLSVNLYSIRSGQNWGAGDFSDLRSLVEWIAGLKGSFIGINPLHAIPNSQPFGVSPYSPISRLYRNFIYLDTEKVPEVAASDELKKTISSKKYRKEIENLNKEALIAYERIASIKETILRKAFDIFHAKHYSHSTNRGKAFRKYLVEEGSALARFATYMALYDHFSGKGHRKGDRQPCCYSWQEWPEHYRDPSGQAVEEFRKEHKIEVLFYQYIQWLIDGQLRDIAEDAAKHGMKIGLYHDLAVGSAGSGSDAWSYQNVIAGGTEVGAPPDDFSPDGQTWGFPPMLPEEMRETGYELFIQTMRRNMKSGGALRIDHALGLFRLFWVPEGLTPKDGAYVSYPAEDFLRIIALESIRNHTVVIAEDLGTIGENMREALQRFQMLSYRLFYFERNYPDPSFLPPDKYPAMALCAVTTHDLPTLTGYWGGRDIELRKQAGKYRDEAQWQEQIYARERDKGLILRALKSHGILSPEYPSDPVMIPQIMPELCRAVYQYLARTRCKLLLVSLDDIIGTMDQQNMPGTIDAHPNWMQKTPLTLEEMMKDRRFVDLSEMLKNFFLM
jgi:4-alpha-glucanotransferase